MPKIFNASYSMITTGDHPNYGPNTVLIRILDKDNPNPRSPKFDFKDVFEFSFMDTNEQDGNSITDDQASEIAKILRKCMDNDTNVIVHCSMGICRSGAVAEVGHIIGFKIDSTNRIPNILVKGKLLSKLGLSYS